ncbi:hypothetical protein BCR44DRAFT_97550 [Catenaria anguillulae PL171]|uniref:Uncharacterized protein n=1 Tax=Catenaria anguillulae PL171 TaxID=765915 RepID=A0A1Y2I080_9FUNG|nr:hypothetical protein BCR44DRAFT_97550 [Catenaria anguillulae PL171]
MASKGSCLAPSPPLSIVADHSSSAEFDNRALPPRTPGQAPTPPSTPARPKLNADHPDQQRTQCCEATSPTRTSRSLRQPCHERFPIIREPDALAGKRYAGQGFQSNHCTDSSRRQSPVTLNGMPTDVDTAMRHSSADDALLQQQTTETRACVHADKGRSPAARGVSSQDHTSDHRRHTCASPICPTPAVHPGRQDQQLVASKSVTDGDTARPATLETNVKSNLPSSPPSLAMGRDTSADATMNLTDLVAETGDPSPIPSAPKSCAAHDSGIAKGSACTCGTTRGQSAQSPLPPTSSSFPSNLSAALRASIRTVRRSTSHSSLSGTQSKSQHHGSYDAMNKSSAQSPRSHRSTAGIPIALRRSTSATSLFASSIKSMVDAVVNTTMSAVPSVVEAGSLPQAGRPLERYKSLPTRVPHRSSTTSTTMSRSLFAKYSLAPEQSKRDSGIASIQFAPLTPSSLFVASGLQPVAKDWVADSPSATASIATLCNPSFHLGPSSPDLISSPTQWPSSETACDGEPVRYLEPCDFPKVSPVDVQDCEGSGIPPSSSLPWTPVDSLPTTPQSSPPPPNPGLHAWTRPQARVRKTPRRRRELHHAQQPQANQHVPPTLRHQVSARALSEQLVEHLEQQQQRPQADAAAQAGGAYTPKHNAPSRRPNRSIPNSFTSWPSVLSTTTDDDDLNDDPTVTAVLRRTNAYPGAPPPHFRRSGSSTTRRWPFEGSLITGGSSGKVVHSPSQATSFNDTSFDPSPRAPLLGGGSLHSTPPLHVSYGALERGDRMSLLSSPSRARSGGIFGSGTCATAAAAVPGTPGSLYADSYRAAGIGGGGAIPSRSSPIAQLILLTLGLVAFALVVVTCVFVGYMSTHPLADVSLSISSTSLVHGAPPLTSSPATLNATTDADQQRHVRITMDLTLSGTNRNTVADIVLIEENPLVATLVELDAELMESATDVLCSESNSDPLLADVCGYAALGDVLAHRHRTHFRFPPGQDAMWTFPGVLHVEDPMETWKGEPAARAVWERFTHRYPPGDGGTLGMAGRASGLPNGKRPLSRLGMQRLGDPTSKAAVIYALKVQGQYEYTVTLAVGRIMPVCSVYVFPA